MVEASKIEVQQLLAQLQSAPRPRISALTLKVGAGYAAMALFTAAALLYSFGNLYESNRTTRRIADTDLPAVTALIKMRSSLLAQEGFAGKYAILKDATFIELFRKRKLDLLADLQLLERTHSVADIAGLKGLYLDYQKKSERLFAGTSHNKEELHASALRLLAALDALYVERQGTMQSVLQRADERQKLAVRWAIALACAGFLLSICIAPFTIYRMLRALRALQKETHRIASGHLNYQPQLPALEELGDLTRDFNQMAARMKEMEQMNQDTLPLTRLPGNLAIERALNERLASGTPFCFCQVELADLQPFLAHYGYAKAAELLHTTGVLIHAALTAHGAAHDFAGHAWGCSYVMAVSTNRVAPVCDAVVEAFDAEVMRQLAPGDAVAGTRVFIRVLDCSSQAYASAVEVARGAVELRDALQPGPGSSWGRVSQQPTRELP